MVNFDPNFEYLISTNLRDKLTNTVNALRGTGPLPPIHFGDVDHPAPLTKEETKLFFDTEVASVAYHKAVAEDDPNFNTINVKMIAKLQNDLIAQKERDYKTQKMSRIRSIAHEATRRDKQSKAGGGVQAMIQYIQNFMTLRGS